MKKSIRIILSLFTAYITLSVMAGCSETKDMQKAVSKEEGAGISKITATNKGQKSDLQLQESKAEWTAKKLTGQHSGSIQFTGGNIYMDNNTITGGSFEVDFNTIKVLDLQDPAMNLKLTNHLKSSDFFSAEQFPLGKFTIKSVSKISDDKYNITGTMVIKNIPKEISFPVQINMDGNKIMASADLNLDRTLWDIKYRSGKFYDSLGDNLIYDDFNLKLNLTFNKN